MKNYSQREVADEFMVKSTLVSCLVRKAKANVNFLKEIRTKVDEKQKCIGMIMAETQGLMRKKEIIHKASMVKHLLVEKHGLEVKNGLIYRVFR